MSPFLTVIELNLFLIKFILAIPIMTFILLIIIFIVILIHCTIFPALFLPFWLLAVVSVVVPFAVSIGGPVKYLEIRWSRVPYFE